jgi:hypothetical protein
MTRLPSLSLVAFILAIPACSSQQAPEPQPPAAVVEAVPIPPPPPPFVDVLPEFKKSARAFLDLAKKLHEAATTKPAPPYLTYWKECEPLEEIYGKVISNEPKAGAGANALDRVNKIRDSLFQTRLALKNKDGLRGSQVAQLLQVEADKRRPLFEEAEFFWKQTPDFTKLD